MQGRTRPKEPEALPVTSTEIWKAIKRYVDSLTECDIGNFDEKADFIISARFTIPLYLFPIPTPPKQTSLVDVIHTTGMIDRIN